MNACRNSIALVCLLIVAVFAAHGVAWGQVDRSGGAAGGSDKAGAGGGTNTPVYTGPYLPQTIHLVEHAGIWGEFTATLTHTSGNNYQANWNHGVTSTMSVQIGGTTMTIERVDTGGSLQLCRGHYTGTRVAGASKASGQDTVRCTIGGGVSTWDATW